jgi:phage terminase large subunit-like protein
VSTYPAIVSRGEWLKTARPDQIPPEHLPEWSYYLILSGRGWGKDLDVATPLPTPTGWTTMGAVKVGDALLDEQGRPCRVLGKFYPETTRAFRLTFSDGTSLVAGGEHQWVTLTHNERKRYLRSAWGAQKTDFPLNWVRLGEIRTTDDLVATFTHGSRGDLNHCIPITRPLELPDAQLPIPPWLFGYWLANGHSDAPCVTAGSYEGDFDDDYVTWRLVVSGFSYRFQTRRYRGSSTICVRGLKIPDAKEIPAAYLRASVSQRLQLLQGLMDGDGHAQSTNEMVEYCSTSERLARGVLELVRSLGERPAFYEGDATLDGRVISRKYRIVWRPTLFNPFGLPRKQRRVHPPAAQGLRLRHRMVVSIEPLASAPKTACVMVDSPNSMYLAGEGMIPTHNTRTSAEDCAWYAQTHSGEIIHVVCPTDSDVRGVYFEGPSGLLRFLPRASIAKAIKSPYYEVTLTNGAVIKGFSAEKPDRLRGPQCHRAYADELAAWRTPKENSKQVTSNAWDQLLFGLRLGRHPRVIITTTPRPTPLVRSIINDPLTLIVRGSTFANAANLAPTALAAVKKKYDGTRLGRQELYGEVLDDVPGALWTRLMIDDARKVVRIPDFERVVVAVDPSGVRNESDTGSDEVGIVVVAKGVDGRGYVLADWSCRMSPLGWGRRAIQAFHAFGADRIIGERNFGGAMVEHTIKSIDGNVAYREVVASRGKVQRAEPISALYEQGRVSHIADDMLRRQGVNDVPHDLLTQLEDQMCAMTSTGFLGDGSPDRVDALVWGLTELFLGEHFDGFLGHYRAEKEAMDKRHDEAVANGDVSAWFPPRKT